MFGFGNKLKKEVWYDVDDQIKLKYIGDGHIKISFRDNMMSMDIPNYVYSLYYEQVLLPRIEAMKASKENGGGDLGSMSIDDLNGLLDIYTKKEEFEVCSRIKKEIDARSK